MIFLGAAWMGLFSTIFEARGATRYPVEDDFWYRAIDTTSDTGLTVSSDGAMSSAAVWRAVANIADSIAKTPLHLYRRLEQGSEPAKDDPLFEIVRSKPNPYLTGFEFWEMLAASAVVRGNAFAEIERDQRGRVRALWPLWAAYMEVDRKGGEIVYRYRYKDINATLPADRVYQLRGFSLGGLVALNPVQTCKNAISLAMVLEKFACKFFKNGAAIGGLLQHPTNLSDGAAKRVRESVEARAGGLENAHRLLILEEGMKYERMGVDPAAAQVIESRTFSVQDVARVFNMPPHKLFELSRATFSNIEQQDLNYLGDCLDPWYVRIEQRCAKHLLPESQSEDLFFEYVRASQLRVDTLARYQAYQIAVTNGLLTRNEVRALENKNPLPGGDNAMIPLNMQMVDEDGEIVGSGGQGSEGQGAGDGDRTDQGDQADQGDQPDEGVADRARAYLGVITAEQRRAAAVSVRERIRSAWRPAFERAGTPYVESVMDYFNVQLGAAFAMKDVQAVARKLDELYKLEGLGNGKKYRDAHLTNAFLEQMKGVFHEYSKEVGRVAAEEAGMLRPGAPKDWMTRTEDIESFIRGFGWKRATSSIGQLQQIARTFGAGAVSGTEAAEAVQAEILKRMKEWQEGGPSGATQAQKISSRAVTQADGFIARDIWKRAGVTKVTWQAGAKACPLCQQLNGRVVGVQRDEAFVPKGMMVDPEGGIMEIDNDAKGAVKAGADVMHPPLHSGCECVIVLG